MKRIRARNIDKDEEAQIMGIPLYILIIVIIATISLAAIMGFMVTREASINNVEIRDVEIDGELEDELYCDDIREDGHAYYKGSERPHPDDPDDTLPPEGNYSEHLIVTVYDEDGNEMPGVDVELTGAGVDSVGTTNGTGQVELSLDGLHLTPGEDNAKLEVEATADGLIGSETASASIWVRRKTG